MLVILLLTFNVLQYSHSYPSGYDDLDSLSEYNVEFEPLQDGSDGGNVPPAAQPPAPPQHAGAGEQGLSAGSSLRVIAEGSLQSAKDAFNNQDSAGHQAAYVAKNTLAQAAASATATAQAALVGKQILLQGLQQQYREAQQAAEGERQQLIQAKRSAVATRTAAIEARNHVNALTAALNAAQAAADRVTQAASEAAGELSAQQTMVGQAIQRTETIFKQLQAVTIDYEATRVATINAQNAAQAAAANAAAAAAAAAAELAKSANNPLPPLAPPTPQPAPPPQPPKAGSNGGGSNGGGNQGGTDKNGKGGAGRGAKGKSGGKGKAGGQGGQGDKRQGGQYIQNLDGNSPYIDENYYSALYYVE